MAQHDYVIANGTGAAVRSDLNNALAAIVSDNSGATAPSPTYAYQLWIDSSTSPATIKRRDGSNASWITVGAADGSVAAGSASTPTIFFTGDSNTGIYSPGADQVAISTGGSGRLFVDASGRVGVGTASPSYPAHIVGAKNISQLFIDAPTISAANDYTQLGFGLGGTAFGSVRLGFDNPSSVANSYLGFWNNGGSGLVERLRITSAGLVGIGTTSPGATVETASANTSGDDNIGNFYIRTTNAQGSNVGGKLTLGGLYNSSATYAFAGIAGRKENATSGNVAGYLQFSTTTSAGALSERARIDSSGRLLVGTSSARGNFFNSTNTARLQVEGTGVSDPVVSIVSSSSSGSVPATLVLGKQNSGVVGGNTTPASGDFIGGISFQGNDGTEFVEAASIYANVDSTPGTNDMPGRLVFSTTADGASSPTERLRIANNGAWGLAGGNYGSSGEVLTSNGSGSAPTWQAAGGAGTLKAWVNFNGTGVVAIRASGNVSSITDNGTGDYTVNFTTAMPDANYSANITAKRGSLNESMFGSQSSTAPATGSCRIIVGTGSFTLTDGDYVNVAIFR